MESLGAISENEWSSFNTAMYSNEESQFMAQLFNDCSVPGEFHGGSCFIWPDHEYKSTTMVDIDSINSLDWNHIHAPNNDYMLSDYCMKEASNVLGNDEFLNREMILTLQETPLPCKEVELKHAVQKDRKRSYNNVGDTAEKKKRVVKSRKSQKLNSSSKIDDDMKFEVPRQSSSSYSLDDDDELNAVSGGLPVALADTESVDTIGKKTRASKSSANDPQSIYARKRRERINERLRTLQNLVPNGTKVDISTMLEEAVQYVKFLQLQIKLLSSNDLWMYAPIAYNGMDLGLDLNTSMPRQQQ